MWYVIEGIVIGLLAYFVGANNPPKSVIQKALDKLNQPKPPSA